MNVGPVGRRPTALVQEAMYAQVAASKYRVYTEPGVRLASLCELYEVHNVPGVRLASLCELKRGKRQTSGLQ